MPKLTKKRIEDIPIPDSGRDVIVWDSELKGFGIRVKISGIRTYFVNYRNAHGRMRRISIGRYGTIAPSKARRRALKILGEVSDGGDPAAERRAARGEATFRDLAEEYIERRARQKKSGLEDIRIIEKDLLKPWGHLPAGEVKRRDVIRLVDEIKDRGAPIMANRTLAVIRREYNFGISRDIVEANPTVLVKPPGQENRRDRVLDGKEIKILWERLDGLQASPVGLSAIRFILATVQRPGEVVTAEWSEIDLEAGWWTIPAEKSKNGLAHRVPLSPLALRILKKQERLDSYVFASPQKTDGHFTVNALSRTLNRNRELLGLEHFTPHDLRRTAASHIASMGFSRLVISKVLNHVESGVTAVYDRHSYDKEKRTALNAWSQKLTDILKGRKGTVIPLVR